MDDNLLDCRLTQALETPPAVSIPDDFAARLMQRLPPRPSYAGTVPISRIPVPRIPASRVGAWSIRAALAVLILAMLLFAPWALTRAAIPLTLEVALAAEFAALTVWVSLRPAGR